MRHPSRCHRPGHDGCWPGRGRPARSSHRFLLPSSACDIWRLEEEEEFLFLFYSSDMRALYVIGMSGNLELYQTLFEISDPHCSYSTVELRGSVASKIFL